MIEPDRIAVIGAGVVGVPMAALLAESRISTPAGQAGNVILVQRPSRTSGWKVEALNAGKNPLGGVEPGLEQMIARAVGSGSLRATTDLAEIRDAGTILICVQTDKRGLAPDYDPLFEAVDAVAAELLRRRPGPRPLIVIESTLAPSTMATLIRSRFADRGLRDGTDIDLGHSPNRVMPGRLLERIGAGHKIVSGLRPETAERIAVLYARIAGAERLHRADPLVAEVVKTLENAYRDVRIAYAAEIVRFTDEADIDFHDLRTQVNARLSRPDGASENPAEVPRGGLLIPTAGVGGHCLPKDGILLLWRLIEAGEDLSSSLILEARRINDGSPAWAAERIERVLGSLYGTSVAFLGAAYRPAAADTRNSPALALARILKTRCRTFTLHDPYVRAEDPRLAEGGLDAVFTSDLELALRGAEIIVIGTSHPVYREERIGDSVGLSARAVFDAAHAFRREEFADRLQVYEGIGKGHTAPPRELVEAVEKGFRALEIGLANEADRVVRFLRSRYSDGLSEGIDFDKVRALAATCATGCDLAVPGPVGDVSLFPGLPSRLPRLALSAPAIRA